MIIKKNKNKSNSNEPEQSLSEPLTEEVEEQTSEGEGEGEIDLFSLDNIDFRQRHERRKGDRRRGFRRIDDRNLVSRAREEAGAIKEAAAQEGYNAGIEAALADMTAFNEALKVFFNAKQDVFDNIAPDILAISFDIAKRIIKKETLEHPEIILENIKEILKGLSKDEAKITLKVNPSQAAALKKDLPEVAASLGFEAKITIITDESITEGGCILTTANGIIEATVESQLAVISEVLKGI